MVMFPDGPEQNNTFGTLTPALPSRATGEAKPLTPLPQEHAAHEEKLRKRRVARRRKTGVLPPLEVKRINKNRRKNLKKKAKQRAVPAAPKNPNRPLEAKNRLSTTLKVMSTLAKAEVSVFADVMAELEAMAGPARKRVIEALVQVYG